MRYVEVTVKVVDDGEIEIRHLEYPRPDEGEDLTSAQVRAFGWVLVGLKHTGSLYLAPKGPPGHTGEVGLRLGRIA